jgi:hypothetical protein
MSARLAQTLIILASKDASQINGALIRLNNEEPIVLI